MSFTVDTPGSGRLCNQLFRNLALSIIAEKHNLYVQYSNFDTISKLGIKLYIGKNSHYNTITLTDNNYFEILSQDTLYSNLDANSNYFQTKEISDVLYSYLHKDNIKKEIMNHNPYINRYNNNNDLFVHFRLTDAANWSPGINYYIQTTNIVCKLMSNNIDHIYLSTDEPSHPFIQQYINTFPNTILINYDIINIIQFANTCKNIILSHGTFSAIIGYLAYHSTIFYPKYTQLMWHGDIFSIPEWKCIS